MNNPFKWLDRIVIAGLLIAGFALQATASTPVQIGGRHGINFFPSIFQGTVQSFTYNQINSTTGSGLTSSLCLTSVGSLTGIQVGAVIADTTNATYITAGTKVAALPGSCSTGQIQMTADAAHNLSGDTLSFTNPAGLSAATQATTQVFLISCTTNCYFLVSTPGTLATSATGTFVLANTPVYFGVVGGQYISVIQSATTGTANITEAGSVVQPI